MAVRCNKCSYINPDGTKFCRNCAGSLETSESIWDSPTKTMSTPIVELSTGSTFAGRYQIIEELGKGGMGRVYRALDKELKEEIALKLIKPEIAADKSIIERFSNELRLARKIIHKNVGRMYELMEDQGIRFITMEYVRGEDLKSMIRMSGQLSVATAVKIAEQICEGLSEAHRLGVIHRDLKPSNIIIDREGNARVIDFGIARSLKTKGITDPGVMVGTPEYMSPEQVDGKDTDGRSDIYSLGVIFFEMLTGSVPFEGETPYSVAVKQKTEIPPEPRESNNQIPEDLSRAVLKCMEKTIEKRYQKAEDLYSDLCKIERSVYTTTVETGRRRSSTLKSIRTRIGPRRILIPALVLVFLSFLSVGILRRFPGKKPELILESVSVMVVDFQNLTGDPVFDGSLEHALCARLKEIRFLSDVYSPPQVRQLANKVGFDVKRDLDLRQLQLLGQKEGIDIFVRGTVKRDEKGYSINVIAQNTINHIEIARISEIIESKTKWERTISKIASGLNSKFEEHLLTSASLEAMSAYALAEELAAVGEFHESVNQYLEAIKKDPDLSLAYVGLSNAYRNIGEFEKSDEYLNMAYYRKSQLTEKDRERIYSLKQKSQKQQISVSKSLPESVSILIADFQNETGEPIFDGILEEYLTVGLKGSSFVDIYNRSSARREARRLGEKTEGKLGLEETRLVCLRAGIDTYVGGLIEKNGEGYAVRAWIVDSKTKKKIGEAVQSIESKETLPEAMYLLSSQLISSSSQAPSDSGRMETWTTIATPSLDAMRYYVRAQELSSQWKLDESIEQFRLAIAEDPDFGSAYFGLANVLNNKRLEKESGEYFQEALKRIDSMCERERYRALGAYYFKNSDFREAIEHYSMLVEKFPADSGGYTNLALSYYHARDMKKALEQGITAMKLRPADITSYYSLITYAIGTGDFELAKQYAEKAEEIRPGRQVCMFYVSVALIELLQDRPEKAAEAYELLDGWGSAPASIGVTGMADLALFEGRLDDAEKILEEGIEADLGMGSAAHKLLMLAETFSSLEQKDSALDAVERAVKASDRLEILYPSAQIYVQTGRTERAELLAVKLSEMPQAEARAYAKLIEGDIRLKRDDPEGAIRLYRESLSLLDTWHGHLALGKAYLESKLYSKALSEFEVCLERRGEAAAVFLNCVPTARNLPQIYYYLGRAQEGLRSPAAYDAYRKLLKIKKKGGTDWMIEDARKRVVGNFLS